MACAVELDEVIGLVKDVVRRASDVELFSVEGLRKNKGLGRVEGLGLVIELFKGKGLDEDKDLVEAKVLAAPLAASDEVKGLVKVVVPSLGRVKPSTLQRRRQAVDSPSCLFCHLSLSS